MSENVVSFKVDDEMKRYLNKKDNASAYLRRLVEADMRGEDAELVGLRVQAETLEKQAQSHAKQEKMYQNRAEEIRSLIEQSRKETELTLSEAREQLRDTPKEPTNPAIQTWARKIGMSPEELCDELDGEYSNTVTSQ